MKPQDIVFFIILILIVVVKRHWLWHASLVSFALAGILFLIGNLFTAQRLSWYAAGLMLVYILIQSCKLLLNKHE